MQRKNTIVIGGGIIGLSVAYYLAKEGHEVTLIEKGEIGSGASYGNAGWVANGFPFPTAAPGVPVQGLKWLTNPASPFYIKPRFSFDLAHWLWRFVMACNEPKMMETFRVLQALGDASFSLFEELHQTEKVDFSYKHKGRLSLFTDEAYFEGFRSGIALVREYGVDVKLMDTDQLREMDASISPAVKIGFHANAYAHLDPGLFSAEMLRLIKEMGAEVITQTEVQKIANEGTELQTSRGNFSAQNVILAAGAWSPLLARGLGLRIPIQPAKGYSLTYTRPEGAPRFPLSLPKDKIAVTPMGNKLRFTSVFELAGYDTKMSEQRLNAIRETSRKYFEGMDKLEDEFTWASYRPATPDDLPIIGRSPKYKNLIFATGHGTLGITYSLVTGKLLSQIIQNQKTFMDISPFKPARF